MEKALTSILFFFLLAVVGISQTNPDKSETPRDKKGREWKIGKLLDSDSNSYTTYGNSSTTGKLNSNGTYNSTTSQSGWNHNQYFYTIEGDDYVFIVSRVLSFRWQREPQVTINGPIKYAVQKDKLYFIDDNGREMNGKITKKILRDKK